MLAIRHVFVDDGGVMNDNAVRGPQWQALVAEFFPPRLGGEPAAWAEANRVAVPPLWDDLPRLKIGYRDWDRNYNIRWVQVMCRYLAIESPPEEECLRLAREAYEHIEPRIRAAFPGAAEALRLLRSAGYVLHTASGEPSSALHNYLEGMNVRPLFERLYGPDLVDIFKNGPEYYEAIFADCGVDPKEALVLDDSPRNVAHAREAGAHSLLVSIDGGPGGSLGQVRALAEVPALLARPHS